MVIKHCLLKGVENLTTGCLTRAARTGTLTDRLLSAFNDDVLANAISIYDAYKDAKIIIFIIIPAGKVRCSTFNTNRLTDCMPLQHLWIIIHID